MDTTHPPPARRLAPGFDELAAELTPRLRTYASRRVARDDVEDVVQETLLSLWRTHRDGSQPSAALAFRIADRRIADHHRAAGRLRRRTERAAAHHPTAYAAPEVAEPPDWLRELSPDALAVLLRVVDGLTIAEIAADLGITPGAVSSRLSRLRDRVPHLIGDQS